MTLTFYTYPSCSTCRNAKKWLDNNELTYEEIHLVKNPPSKEEVLKLFSISNRPVRQFFNTRGRVYRELNMKDKIEDLTEEEMATYLASDGMLIRRPIVTDGKKVTIGFKEDTFKEFWL